MKYIISLIFIMCAATIGFAQDNEGIQFQNISIDKAFDAAKKENKLVFVDYSTVGCKPCKQMEIEIFVLPEVAEVVNENFVSVKIDPIKNKAEEKRAREEYGVTGFPTFIFLNSEGKVLKDYSGYQNKEEFLTLVKEVLILK
ncbi:DUF255 domain-containing protein [Ancylomarina salipaludis]|uniref:DUF255 domain-containing protein n=1 Tax=Ancylomarina salipaludis TaxID=2501299 RepID=A0A4Q1JHZ3_9BACT|nr:thioredoxin fold domain-containing protein [Ancylomarina salipaludis]RXQ88047.1 DUF255 domain-containing protein [Ancylomarina salipaludis]